MHGDKGYDTDPIRRQIEATGAMPNIPPKANRRWKNCFSPALYRGRNAIERMFCRLKDFRRVATRYDRLATNFLAAVCIAATVSYEDLLSEIGHSDLLTGERRRRRRAWGHANQGSGSQVGLREADPSRPRAFLNESGDDEVEFEIPQRLHELRLASWHPLDAVVGGIAVAGMAAYVAVELAAKGQFDSAKWVPFVLNRELLLFLLTGLVNTMRALDWRLHHFAITPVTSLGPEAHNQDVPRS
jgi:hypothetical protein